MFKGVPGPDGSVPLNNLPPGSVQEIDLGYRPRPLQAKLHAELKRFNVLVCHRRFGKCLAEGTPIPTPSGFVPIEKLVVGDTVFSELGAPIKVKGTYTNGEQDSYVVKFDTGEEVITDADHVWYVERPLHEYASTKREAWKHGEKLTTKQILESGRKWFIPVTGKVRYPKNKLPIDPYILGYWLGDGSSDDGFLYVCKGDEETLEGFYSNKEDRGGHYRLYIPKLRGRLQKLGLYKNKHIPEIFLTASVEDRISLLQGLMDSDGTVSNSFTCRFDNKNERLIDGFLDLARSLGLKVTKKEYKKRKEFYCLFRKRDFPLSRLRRKDDKALYSGRPIRRQITEVIRTEVRRKFYCISVDNPTHLFLCTDQYIPTHNTVFSIMEMIDQALRNEQKNPQYAYIAPTYGQAKRVAWEYLKDFTKHIPGAKANEADLRIDIPRPDRDDKIRFMLLGAENPDSLRGIYLDGVLLDEYAQCDPTIWGQVIRPALSDRLGWAIFIGTPKGQNHFYDMYSMALGIDQTWYTAIYKASETGIVPDSELEAARLEMSEEEYEQEFECSFNAALMGSYYGKYINELEKKGRLTAVPHEPAALVDTYWDLGISDSTAVWFIQVVGREFHVIDYLESSGVGLDWYVKQLKAKPYIFGEHWIPHDGAARELGTGKTRQESLRELGLSTKIVPRQTVADGIHAVRMVLPKCWFDLVKCARGINALKNYQRKWDAKHKMFVDKPLHDWSSNGSDAFRMFGLVADVGRSERMKNLPREAVKDYNALG